MTSQPKVFISATSRDLGTCRRRIQNALLTLGNMPVEQAHFSPDARTVSDMLRDKIASCDAMIHVVGEVYGAEPLERQSDEPRRSYTQMEYDIAKELGKPVYVFICGDGFPYDTHEPEEPEKQLLQQEYRRKLLEGNHHFTSIHDSHDLELRVHQLQITIEQLRRDISRFRFLLGRGLAVGIVLLLLVGLLWGWNYTSDNAKKAEAQRIHEKEQKKVKADEDVRKKDYELAASEVANVMVPTVVEMSSAVDATNDLNKKWDKFYMDLRANPEKAKEYRNDFVKAIDHAKSFWEKQFKMPVEPPSEKALDILRVNGIEMAEIQVWYSTILPHFKKSHLEYFDAMKNYASIAVTEPSLLDICNDFAKNHADYVKFLGERYYYGYICLLATMPQTVYDSVRTPLEKVTLCQGVNIEQPYAESDRQSKVIDKKINDALNKLQSPIITEDVKNRRMESALNIVKKMLDRGESLENRNKLAEAKKHYEDSLITLRDKVQEEPGNPVWKQGLAMVLESLGGLLIDRNDTVGAKKHYLESLAILRQLAIEEPDNIAWKQSMATSLEMIGDLLKESGDPVGAKKHHDESLEITRWLIAKEPDNVEWKVDLATALIIRGEKAGLEEALEILLPLKAAGKLSAEDEEWIKNAREDLKALK